MKTRIAKILGIVLTVSLLSSLAIVAAPVTAAPGQNVWDDIDGPPIVPGSGVGIMEVVESDGTIYAAVFTGGFWHVQKSSNGGASWSATSFNAAMENAAPITDIVSSPNYAVDGTIYVSTMDGRIYRIAGEGSGSVILLKAPVDEEGNTATAVYDLDVWFDGSDTWIVAATDIDVLVLRDSLFEPWRDQQLIPSPGLATAFAVAFAPDFASSNLMWALVDDGVGNFKLTSTISPGQWGNTISEVVPENAAGLPIAVSPDCEIDFAETYTGSAPVVYLALSGGGDTGNVFEIRSAYVPAATQDIALLLTDVDILSIEVSGNVILAGTATSPDGVWRSDNLGGTFNAAIKPPTGASGFYVEMAPGVFDADEGVAYCSSETGPADEGAFSVSKDGGETWNQTAWVDTIHDSTDDLAFSPVTASQPAFIITQGNGVSSLWRTADATAAKAIWVRVASSAALGVDNFIAIDYAADGTNIMLYLADGADLELWKSTDNGQTFNHWRTLATDSNEIVDIVILDGSTIFAACNDTFGFLGTTRFGPFKERLAGVAGVSIALQPGFDPDDPDNSVVIIGDNDGNIYVSEDAGETWGAAQAVGSGDVYVAFDADFQDNGLIYYASADSDVGVAEVDGDELDGAAALEDEWDDDTSDLGAHSGIAVAGDNALYAMGDDEGTALARILLHEDDSIWEWAGIEGASGLWQTEGTNYVWTIVDDLEIWALHDTVSGPVMGVTVSAIGEYSAKVAWTAMTGATRYIWETDGGPWDETTTTSDTMTGLSDNEDYEVRVMVHPGYPFASLWSTGVAFTTLEHINTPEPLVPAQGLQGAPLLPSFVWGSVSNAVSYDFDLSTDPGFGSFIISTNVDVEGYTYGGPDLAYDLNHYWRVRAVSATGTKSPWTNIQNFHTRVEVIVVDPIILPDPVTPVVTVNLPPPQVTVNIPDITVDSPDVIVDVPDIVTVTQPPQQTFVLPERDDPSTPVYIWVIVGIGAILTIAVIVLIIRTRRVV